MSKIVRIYSDNPWMDQFLVISLKVWLQLWSNLGFKDINFCTVNSVNIPTWLSIKLLAELLMNWTLRANYSEILIKIQQFSFWVMHKFRIVWKIFDFFLFYTRLLCNVISTDITVCLLCFMHSLSGYQLYIAEIKTADPLMRTITTTSQ